MSGGGPGQCGGQRTETRGGWELPVLRCEEGGKEEAHASGMPARFWLRSECPVKPSLLDTLNSGGLLDS